MLLLHVSDAFPQRVVIILFADVPNAGEGLKRLQYRQQWDADLRAYLKKLDQSKPVICCGDMNVAHHPIGMIAGVDL